jgi:hypothetical protein
VTVTQWQLEPAGRGDSGVTDTVTVTVSIRVMMIVGTAGAAAAPGPPDRATVSCPGSAAPTGPLAGPGVTQAG